MKRLLTVQEGDLQRWLGRSKFDQEVALVESVAQMRPAHARRHDEMEAWAAGLPIASRKSEAA